MQLPYITSAVRGKTPPDSDFVETKPTEDKESKLHNYIV